MKDIKTILKDLCDYGVTLQLLFIRDCLSKVDRSEKAEQQLKEAEKVIKNLNFEIEYQKWYTKSSQFIKTFIPDRYSEFVSLYLPDLKRKNVDVCNYTIYDSIRGIKSSIVRPISGFAKLVSQIAIVKSLFDVFESKLYDIKNILEFNFFEKEIDSARALLKANYLRSAGALCGVILEEHLIKMLEKTNVAVPANKSLGDYIQMLQTNSIIDSVQFKFLTYLSGIRNKCDHKKSADPTKEEIESLIEGTSKVISTY